MATYDGTYLIVEGRSSKDRKRTGRARRAAIRHLHWLAAQPARLAHRLEEVARELDRLARVDANRTGEDLRKLAGLSRELARRLEKRAWYEVEKTAADLQKLAGASRALALGLARQAREDAIRTADDLKRLAALAKALAHWMARQARDDATRTVEDLRRVGRLSNAVAVRIARQARDDAARTAEDLKQLAALSMALAARMARHARDDALRTADDLRRLAGFSLTFASRMGRLAWRDAVRTADDLRRLARLASALARRMENCARNDAERTAGHVKQLAGYLRALAWQLNATARRLRAQAALGARSVADRLESTTDRLKIRAGGQARQLTARLRWLAALPGRGADRLAQRADHLQWRIGHGLARLGARLERAGGTLNRQADDGLRQLARRGSTLARLPWQAAVHAAQRCGHGCAAFAAWLEKRAMERRRLAGERAQRKMAGQQALLKHAEDEAKRKLAEKQARLDLAEERKRMKRAEEQREVELARQRQAAAAMKEQAADPPKRQAVEESRVADHRVEPADRPRRVLILVENLPSPFDRRVWQEATALRDAGYLVSIICPTGKGYEKKFEDLDGIHIWRYDLPVEAEGALGYLAEYAIALTWTSILAWRVHLGRGFDAIHACNPPDLLFLVGGFFKLLGKKFLFDHHDINPELYEAKFGRRDVFYRLLVKLERWSFRTADVSIATNGSYRRIAIERGGMRPERVFIVRSGPSLARMKIVPPDERWKRGRRYLVGYVGVMGKQEGIDCLLRAVRLIVSRHGRTDIHFGLVGGGTSLEEMKALAKRLEIDDYVTFTGRVPDAEMLSVLNTAELCVNPDIASEMNDKSTMNKIMEYMALGKPIVQFDLTEGRYSARGAALNARRDDVADFADRILELIDDPELRARMGAIGRARVVNELSWDHEVPKLLAAYDCLWASGTEAAMSPRPASVP